MEVILLHIIYASLIIFGIWNSANPGMIFHKFDLYLEPRLGWFYKPIIGCSVCMASVWGSAYYLTFVSVDFGVFLFVPALSGFNYFVAQNLIK